MAGSGSGRSEWLRAFRREGLCTTCRGTQSADGERGKAGQHRSASAGLRRRATVVLAGHKVWPGRKVAVWRGESIYLAKSASAMAKFAIRL